MQDFDVCFAALLKLTIKTTPGDRLLAGIILICFAELFEAGYQAGVRGQKVTLAPEVSGFWQAKLLTDVIAEVV